MNLLSLCTGYGGLDLAVEAVTGAHTRWVSDIDRDACAVQAVRFPDAEQLGDLKQIDWSTLAGQVDIITAGYPCQPFSQAGLRKGTEDERHLWPWIADAIRTLRPRLIVLENVAGHLRRGFDIVLADLAEMGMSARWGSVRASDAGAPHRRQRLFVVAYPSDVGPYEWSSCDRTQGFVEVESGGDADRRSMDAADTDTQSRDQRSSCPNPLPRPETIERLGRRDRLDDPIDWGQFTPAVNRWEHLMGRGAPAPLVEGSKRLNAHLVEWMMGLPEGWVTDILPNRRALRVLGNGVVPQQAELALRGLLR